MDVKKWLEEQRGLNRETADHFRVRLVDHGNLGQAVALPYIKNGETYAGKFRSVDKKDWRSTQGVSRDLFNLDALTDYPADQPIILTEGEFDCMAIKQAGFDRVVSLPDGWSDNSDKRDCLIRNVEAFKNAPFVIAAGDNDEAGESLPRVLAAILDGHDVRFVDWPKGCKDANDTLLAHGEAEIVRCLSSATQIDPEGGAITGMSDLPPMPERRVLRMGLDPYDFRLAFEVGAMSVGTGTPGSGKSTFTTFAAYHVAVNENIRAGFLPFETHAHTLRDQLSLLHSKKVFKDLNEQERERFNDFGDNRFRIVHRKYGSVAHDLVWLRKVIHTLAVRDNCKLIIIDPWNELEHLPDAGESLTNYINFALQQIRQWAEDFNAHICVVAHPKKLDPNTRPSGYDVADSAAFNNKPALGFSVYRHMDVEKGEDWTELITWKVRNTLLYGIDKGRAKLEFYPDAQTYASYRDDSFDRSKKAAKP